MSDKTSAEIAGTLRRLTGLFIGDFDIRDPKSIHNIYYFSAITEILIHTNDLLQKLSKENKRIKFTDDIRDTNKHSDVTDLINHFRNAACHNDSDKRRTKAGILHANCVYYGFDYPDDVSFIMGDATLLLKRHLERAYKEIFKIYSKKREILTQHDYKIALIDFKLLYS